MPADKSQYRWTQKDDALTVVIPIAKGIWVARHKSVGKFVGTASAAGASANRRPIIEPP
eukprot:gene6134-13746_t